MKLIQLPNNRIKELLSVIEETSGKVIIWATYRNDIKNIAEALKKEHGMDSVGTYFGDTPTDERQEVLQKFQDEKDPMRFFVGNPKTGGFGVTLTQASVVVYFSNSFDLEVRLQSEDRAHRIGQTRNVVYVDLIASNTIDEKIVKSLKNKINIASEVLGEEVKKWIM